MPVIPVPGTAARNTGVCGRPLPAEITLSSTVHSFSSFPPRHPFRACVSTHAHARGVLNLRLQQVSLIEVRWSALAAQIQPVLRDGRRRQGRRYGQGFARSLGSHMPLPTHLGIVIDCLRIGVIDARCKAAAQSPPR